MSAWTGFESAFAELFVRQTRQQCHGSGAKAGGAVKQWRVASGADAIVKNPNSAAGITGGNTLLAEGPGGVFAMVAAVASPFCVRALEAQSVHGSVS